MRSQFEHARPLAAWMLPRTTPAGADGVQCLSSIASNVRSLGSNPNAQPDYAEDIPCGEVTQCRAEHDEVGCGGSDHIARALDQRQTDRSDELAAIATAIAEAHAAGVQPGQISAMYGPTTACCRIRGKKLAPQFGFPRQVNCWIQCLLGLMRT
jgi:hypothetical protein